MAYERYKMEYVNCEVSTITDTYDNHELTAEEIVELLNSKDKTSQDFEDVVSNFFIEHESEFSQELKDEISLLFDIEWDVM